MAVKTTSLLNEIPGVELLSEIGRGARGIVYRGRRAGEIVAVKVAQDSFVDARESQLWFRREGAILACVAHPGLAEIVELGDVAGRPYLVREFVAGRTVAEELAGGPLSQDRVVAMAVVLAGALAEVHRHGLIHRDVKPQNIMLRDDGLGAKLIDFGLATRLQQNLPENEMVGTFLYSAPEQSGMIRRPVDGRSDLYALGVVMFECCCGSPPFTSSDVGELIRCHAVVPPPDLRKRNAAIGTGLNSIILRLLAKDPDDRYQTGDGLVDDLNRLASIDAGPEARLGIGEQRAPSSFEPRWVGRQPELELLLERLQQALRGQGAVVLVESEPGGGKSRLVGELMARVNPAEVLCLGARCGTGDAPLQGLREAVDSYLRSLARRPEAEQRDAHKDLRTAAGSSAALVGRISPALAALLGDSAAPTPLPEGSDQFHQALADWLVKLVDHFAGAVLWFDDAHWMDDCTRNVLCRLAQGLRRLPILLIGAMRDDEASLHSAEQLLGELDRGVVTRLRIPPLSEDEVGQLLVSHLGGRRIKPQMISKLAVRTQGNPFTLGEYVQALLDGGLLRPVGASWELDEEGLDRLELPSDVLKLVLSRMDEIEPAFRDILNRAAVLGQRFELETLASLTPGAAAVTFQAVALGTELRLLERSQSNCYIFVHDRVRQAFLAQIPLVELRELHQQLAELLEQRGSKDAEAVYARARHYGRGQPGRTPEPLYRSNLEAGRLALANYAFEQAYGFLLVALGCRPDVPDPECGELLGKACLQTGRLEEGLSHLQLALDACGEPLARARLLARQGEAQLALYDIPAARRAATLAFSQIGSPLRRSGRPATAYYLSLWLAMEACGYRKATSAQERERLRIQSVLLEQSALQCWFEHDYEGMLELGSRGVLCAWRLGPSRELVRAYSKFAYYLGLLRRGSAIEHYIRKGKKLARSLGDPVGIAHVALFHALALQQAGQAVQAELMLRRHLEDHGQWLDSIDYSLGCTALVFNLLTRGRAREARVWLDRAYRRQQLTSDLLNPIERLTLNCYSVCCLSMLGETVEALDYVRLIHQRFPDPSRSRDLASNLLGFLIGFQLEQGEKGRPLDESIERFRALGLNPARVVSTRRFGFLWQAYARLAQCQGGSDVARLREAADELKQAATIPALKTHSLVIEAAWQRLQGQPQKALATLCQAEVLACQIDSPWALFEISLERGRAFAALGNREACEEEARSAHSRACSQGWSGRARRLSREFSLSTVGSGTGGSSTEEPGEAPGRHQRQLQALLQVSQAAGSFANPTRQARVCLDELIRLLGAERGFLFLATGADKSLELLAGRDAAGQDLAALTGFSRTVVEEVRSSGQPLVLSGSEEGRLLGSESVVAHDLRSIIATPLTVRGALVGVAYLDNRLARGVFNEDDVAISVAVSNHIAIALENARLARLEVDLEAERRQRDLAETMRDLATSLSSTLNQKEVLQRLLVGLAKVVPYQRARAVLRPTPREEFSVIASTPADDWTGTVGPPDLLAEVANTRRPHTVVDSWRDPRFATGDSQGSRAWMAVPVAMEGEVAVVLILDHPRPGFYDERLADLCLAFATQAGMALENARLFAQVQLLATTDGLTGLFNRRHFFEVAANEVRRSRRSGLPLSAIMLDVDHFKRINDGHGHAAGDQVLRWISQLCRKNVRDIDVLGRYGGEEFAIMLPQADLASAHSLVAERLRRAVAEESVEIEGGAVLNITISLGVAQLESDTADLAALFSRADAALYAAKAGGRNRAICG